MTAEYCLLLSLVIASAMTPSTAGQAKVKYADEFKECGISGEHSCIYYPKEGARRFGDKGDSDYSPWDKHGTYINGKITDDGWVNESNGYWFKRSDLMRIWEFHRVTACWPIKRLDLDAGDAVGVVEFTPSGEAIGDFDKKVAGHVYIFGDVVVVATAKLDMVLFDGVYDQVARTLVSTGEWDNIEQITFFSSDELAGCQKIQFK